MTYKEHQNFRHEFSQKSDVMPSCTFSHEQAHIIFFLLSSLFRFQTVIRRFETR